MDATQKLYYALGQLAYVVAKADGKIQLEEKEKLHSIVLKETKHHNLDFDYSEIIFLLLSDEQLSAKLTYDEAMKTFKELKYFFNDDLKADFVAVLEKIASSFPPFSIDEEKFIDKVRKDFKNL